MSDWEPWFAWHPVKTFFGWHWLGIVERKKVDNGLKGSESHRSWYIYR